MEDLRVKRCVPCEGGIPPLREEEIAQLLPQVSAWGVVPTEDPKAGTQVKTLQRSVRFSDFKTAMAFLNDVAQLAEAEGHHPDFCVHYNRVDFTLWTHAIGGLHDNDFILAAKIDDLVEAHGGKNA